jgi:hypothetical protein
MKFFAKGCTGDSDDDADEGVEADGDWGHVLENSWMRVTSAVIFLGYLATFFISLLWFLCMFMTWIVLSTYVISAQGLQLRALTLLGPRDKRWLGEVSYEIAAGYICCSAVENGAGCYRNISCINLHLREAGNFLFRSSRESCPNSLITYKNNVKISLVVICVSGT